MNSCHSHSPKTTTKASEENSCHCHCCHCHDKDVPHKESLFGEWGAPALTLLLLFTAWAAGHFGNPTIARWLGSWWMYAAAAWPVGWPVLKGAWSELRRGSFFTEFTLMTLAGIGAFAIGEYVEGVAVLLFYAIGERFQERAVGKARRSIEALTRLRPERVTIEAADGLREVAPEAVQPDTIIHVPVGGRVPIDGLLMDGDSELDTAALTGESLPRLIREGEEVSAGMIATTHALRLRTLRPYSESALARILRMVEEAAARKAPTELFIRRFARYYTPAVVVLALSVLLWAWWSHGALTMTDVRSALIFLVVSCPCALLIGVPLTYYHGIGSASAAGVLFKGGQSLDTLAKIKGVAFDKTGTLTEGQLQLREIVPTREMTAADLLRLAAICERPSTHPVARALWRAAEERFGATETATWPHAEGMEEQPGRGITAQLGGQRIHIGRIEWLEGHGVQLPEAQEAATLSQQATPAHHAEGTLIYCAVDGRFVGSLAFCDTLRPTSRQAVAALRKLGVRWISILSGDRKTAVAAMARELDVHDFRADLLPGDKERYIAETEKSIRGGVAFVGDGLNDAPAMAAATVGIAMGQHGSDAAIETADIVVQDSNPEAVARALRIATFTHRKAIINIVIALGAKGFVMLLGLWGYAPLWAAVLADTGVTLLCVLIAITGRRGNA